MLFYLPDAFLPPAGETRSAAAAARLGPGDYRPGQAGQQEQDEVAYQFWPELSLVVVMPLNGPGLALWTLLVQSSLVVYFIIHWFYAMPRLPATLPPPVAPPPRAQPRPREKRARHPAKHQRHRPAGERILCGIYATKISGQILARSDAIIMGMSWRCRRSSAAVGASGH